MTAAASSSFAWGRNRATLTTRDRSLGDALALVFRAFLIEAPGDDPGDWVHEPTLTARVGDREFSFASLDRAVLALEESLAEQLLEGCEHLLLHAGAVMRGDLVLLILGASGAGKTTTTLELVSRGFSFLGDEYVALDAEAPMLLPFPRSTVVKRPGRKLPQGSGFSLETEAGPLTFHLPEDRATLEPLALAGSDGQAGSRLGLIFPCYAPNAETAVRPLSAAESCARILPSTFNFEGNEAAHWPALSALALRARSFELEYSDVASGIDAALDQIGPE